MDEMNMVEHVEYVLGNSLEPYKTKMEQATVKIERLLEVLDPMLDKPFNENNPHVVCGDVLEQIKETVSDTANQIEYVMNVLMATVSAWYYAPNDESFGIRLGFIQGYMKAINKNEK